MLTEDSIVIDLPLSRDKNGMLKKKTLRTDTRANSHAAQGDVGQE